MQWSQKGAALRLAPPGLLSLGGTQDHQPMMDWALQSVITKTLFRLAYSPILWVHFPTMTLACVKLT